MVGFLEVQEKNVQNNFNCELFSQILGCDIDLNFFHFILTFNSTSLPSTIHNINNDNSTKSSSLILTYLHEICPCSCPEFQISNILLTKALLCYLLINIHTSITKISVTLNEVNLLKMTF